MAATPCQAIEKLLRSYHEINAGFVDELTDPPTPLEFMRQVAANRPSILRRGISHWPALSKWDAKYHKQVMGNQLGEVALTPKGSALVLQGALILSLIYLEMPIRSLRTKQMAYCILSYPRKVMSASTTFLIVWIVQERNQGGNVIYGPTRKSDRHACISMDPGWEDAFLGKKKKIIWETSIQGLMRMLNQKYHGLGLLWISFQMQSTSELGIAIAWLLFIETIMRTSIVKWSARYVDFYSFLSLFITVVLLIKHVLRAKIIPHF